MNKSFLGKAVSIHCVPPLGIFQGTIKSACSEKITIIRAFRNGLPLRTLDTEITIMATDIVNLEIIPTSSDRVAVNGIAKTKLDTKQNFTTLEDSLANFKMSAGADEISPPNSNHEKYKMSNSPRRIFGNMIPAVVEARLAVSAPNTSSSSTINVNENNLTNNRNASKPIDIIGGGGGGGNGFGKINPFSMPFKNEKKKSDATRRQAYTNNQAFGTPIDDITMEEEFDFEKNLALFDKQAIWHEIDATQKPDLLRQTIPAGKKKNFRHNENVLVSKPIGYRQITTNYASEQVFATDDGLIIPSIRREHRDQIQINAEKSGLTRERQFDILARGTVEIALQLLGGARRLTPQNRHQWPNIVIICDDPYNYDHSEIGLSTGRQLASQGLNVMTYVNTNQSANKAKRLSTELQLYKATNGLHTNAVQDLPTCDLVILALRNGVPSMELTKWISENRSPVIAIDPPISGITNVTIKCSIIPILPVDGINSSSCGKLYLCNIGIPEKFYFEADIKYKSPFGHKFVIPLHMVKDD